MTIKLLRLCHHKSDISEVALAAREPHPGQNSKVPPLYNRGRVYLLTWSKNGENSSIASSSMASWRALDSIKKVRPWPQNSTIHSGKAIEEVQGTLQFRKFWKKGEEMCRTSEVGPQPCQIRLLLSWVSLASSHFEPTPLLHGNGLRLQDSLTASNYEELRYIHLFFTRFFAYYLLRKIPIWFASSFWFKSFISEVLRRQNQAESKNIEANPHFATKSITKALSLKKDNRWTQ